MDTSDAYATLVTIFGAGEIVIPDMQRDYCWASGGDASLSPDRMMGGERVTSFVSSIAYIYGRHADPHPNMGQLYGYEYPPDSGRWCVIDGQQRLTTLYLLLGMLYRRVPTQPLRDMLMTADERPRLVYQSRREPQYFLTDLARHFFLDRDGRLSQLERSPWFFQDYNTDPTVVSIIGAIRLIDDVLERASATFADWDFADFARFVTEGLRFVVCDLGARGVAEQFFVILNTTGEPLTPPQRLRSAIEQTGAGNTLYQRYNDMEDWLWQHRDTSLSDDVTADADMLAVMQAFARWHGPFALLQSNNPFEITQDDLAATAREGLERLCDFFDIYRRIMSTPAALADPLRHQPLDGSAAAYGWLMRLLACVALVERFGAEATDADIERMWLYLANITRYQRATDADIQAAVETVGAMATPDILCLLKQPGASRRIVTDESRAALQFVCEHRGERERAEALIRRAQDHPVLCGRTRAIIGWAGTQGLDGLQHYTDGLYSIFGTDIDEQPALDLVRRALLTLGYRDYPLVRRGNSVLSLCWQDYDWQRLAIIAPSLLKRLIDNGNALQSMVDDYDDTSYPYYFLIKDTALIGQLYRRQFLRPCKVFAGLPIGDSHDERGVDTLWYIEQRPLADPAMLAQYGWATVRAYGTRCLYTDHTRLNLAIDIYYQPDERSRYRLEVFSRPDADPQRRRAVNIKPLLAASGLTFRYDRERRRNYTYLPTADAVIRALARLLLV